MHDRLNQMVSDPEGTYAKASDEKRALMILNVVNGYRKAAEAALLKNNPGITATYKDQMRAKGRAITAPRPSRAPGIFINPAR